MRKHSIQFDPKEGLTKQSFKDECNINKIMAKFQRTGMINHYSKHAPQYMNIPAIEYHEALNMIAEANSMFAELPSSVRDKFANDPEKFLEFVQNPKNNDELVEMGLANPPLSSQEPDPPTKPSATAPTEPPQGSEPQVD